MATTGPYEIRSEARGPHWIAWLTKGGSDRPDRAIVVVGETQEEAETRARQFAERTAVNTPLQGTAADIIKIAMVRIYRLLQKKSLSSKMLLQVHDELVLEVPKSELDEARELVRREMENAAELKVPLRVDVNVADNWKDMK